MVFVPALHRGPRCANGRPLRSFGSVGKHHTLLYNSAVYFLALAIADKALLHIESLEDLLGQGEMDLIFKDSVLDLPILRKCTKWKGTTEEPMPKHAFTQILRAMLRKAGYFARATIHAIGPVLVKRSTVSHFLQSYFLVPVPFSG